MRLAIEVSVECPEWEKQPNLDVFLAESLQAVLDATGEDVREGAEVSFLFCDDARIRELNRQFRGKDKPTNVLSFPGPVDDAQFLGDIALAFETISREAQEQGKSLEHHCRHMIVHGFLHLLGYDHEESIEAEEMEATEIRILQALGVEDPYCDDKRETEVNGRA
jgi:probable rRNA maturation factor